MAEYLTDKIEFNNNVYKCKPCIEQSKTFTGLIGSANDAAGASFYVGKIVPTTYTSFWSIDFREYIYAAGQETNSQQTSIVHIEGRYTGYSNYRVYNTFYNTSYYSAYYTNFIPTTQAGFNSGYGHLIGIGLRGSWNRTTAANARTITYEILDTRGCTFTFFDSAVKYASVPGTGSTNYGSLAEFNFTSNGLVETGNNNDPNYRNRDYYLCRLTATATGRYKICFTKRDGSILPANAVDNNVNTGKAMTTEAFDPFGPIYYLYSSSSIAAGSTNNGGAFYRQWGDLVDLRYSFNLNRSTTPYTLPTKYAPVYVVVVAQSDGTVKLDTTAPITQTLPSTPDGKLYIYLGNTYSDDIPYRITLGIEHPIYFYKNGLKYYSGDGGAIYSAGDAISISSSGEIGVAVGTGLALSEDNKLVPNFGTQANTVAQGNHTHTITAAVTDGVWDLTGTNGTNKVTYAVAPYPAATATSSWITTAANAGKFYLGTNRVPYATTRLNYNGYFYARDVYANGLSVDSRLTALEEQICLIEGSKIKMADGTEKNIEDVKTGDMILSYDPANGKQIEAMALQSVRTGVAKDYDVLIFENGNYAELFKEHSIYNVELGYPCSHKEWKVGDIGLMVDGNQSALARITTSRHAIVKQRYVLCTTTGLYFANGILMGIWPSTKYNIVTRPCYNLELPDDILSKFKVWGEANDRSNLLEVNPEFISRSKTIQSTIHRLTKEIEDCKKNLLDTDYVVTKFTEGLISATEWAKSKIKRANWRTMINDDEGPLETAKQQLEKLKAEIKGNNPSLKDIYWGSVTEAISMLPDFQQWFAERSKTEEFEVTIE